MASLSLAPALTAALLKIIFIFSSPSIHLRFVFFAGPPDLSLPDVYIPILRPGSCSSATLKLDDQTVAGSIKCQL